MNLSYPRRQKQLQSLVNRLGLVSTTPIQWRLLDLALTHPTVSSEANYEQLEFVGDAGGEGRGEEGEEELDLCQERTGTRYNDVGRRGGMKGESCIGGRCGLGQLDGMGK